MRLRDATWIRRDEPLRAVAMTSKGRDVIFKEAE